MVVGGEDPWKYISSTEILVEGASSWNKVEQSLPSGRALLRATKIDNMIIITGSEFISFDFQFMLVIL